LIIAGIIVYTIFLVREIHKNEQQDSFLNAVTHELQDPIASIACTWRPWKAVSSARPNAASSIASCWKNGPPHRHRRASPESREARQASNKKNWQESTFPALFSKLLNSTRVRHHLPPEELRFGLQPQEKLLMKGNPQELRTAVFNLVENAVKYSGNKKDIVVDVVTPDIDTVILQIRDHGVGIPPSELKRIFKRFYRVSNSPAGRQGNRIGTFYRAVHRAAPRRARRSPKAKAQAAAVRSPCASRGSTTHDPDTYCRR